MGHIPRGKPHLKSGRASKHLVSSHSKMETNGVSFTGIMFKTESPDLVIQSVMRRWTSTITFVTKKHMAVEFINSTSGPNCSHN